MSTSIDLEEIDDFLSVRKADAAQQEWQTWYRRQVTRLGVEALLPHPGHRRVDSEGSAGMSRRAGQISYRRPMLGSASLGI